MSKIEEEFTEDFYANYSNNNLFSKSYMSHKIQSLKTHKGILFVYCSIKKAINNQ